MAHPSGHGQRSNPTHLATVRHDLQTVLAHIISPHDIQGYLQILASDEAIRVTAHVKDLKALGMRPKVLQSLRPTILHLVEQEWVKRIELVSFLNKQRVKKETLELFFCASLRFNSVQVIKKGIADFVGALHGDFPLVCERVGSSGGSAVSRLVDDPRLFLQSLQTVASKLGQNLDKVWATVCASYTVAHEAHIRLELFFTLGVLITTVSLQRNRLLEWCRISRKPSFQLIS
jgi:hypothetical protein